MGTEIRQPRKRLLPPGHFIPPGKAIARSVFAEHQLAYRRGRYEHPFDAEGCFTPPGASSWAVGADDGEPKSLIPCITAIVIEVMKAGMPSRGRRTPKQHPAEYAGTVGGW